MSSSEAALPNDPYAWIDRYAADLHEAARTLARDGEAAVGPHAAVDVIARSLPQVGGDQTAFTRSA